MRYLGYRAYVSIIISMFLIVVCYSPNVNATEDLSIRNTDLEFTKNNVKIYSANIGDIVNIKVTIINNGDSTSEQTSVMVALVGDESTLISNKGDKSGMAVFPSQVVTISGNDQKTVTIQWDTSKVIGTSIYKAGPGTYSIQVFYNPEDESIPETDYNAGIQTSSSKLTLKEKSEGDSGDIIGVCVLIIVLLIIVVVCIYMGFRSWKKRKSGEAVTKDTKTQIEEE